MLLLVAGIPGTGKTTIGNYLRDEHEYLHVDIEALIQSAPPGTQWATILASLESQRRSHPNMVLTWGFIPGQDDAVVRALQGAGHRLVWLDGDRDAAKRAFLERGTVSEALFDLQLTRIQQLDIASFNSSVIDPFDPAGRFRAQAAIAADILASAR